VSSDGGTASAWPLVRSSVSRLSSCHGTASTFSSAKVSTVMASAPAVILSLSSSSSPRSFSSSSPSPDTAPPSRDKWIQFCHDKTMTISKVILCLFLIAPVSLKAAALPNPGPHLMDPQDRPYDNSYYPQPSQALPSEL